MQIGSPLGTSSLICEASRADTPRVELRLTDVLESGRGSVPRQLRCPGPHAVMLPASQLRRPPPSGWGLAMSL